MGTLANYGSPGWQRGFYKTAVLLGMVDGKVIFRVAENDEAAADLPVVEFLTTKTYNDNEWHHVAASWDNANNESALYIDGGSLGGATKSETMKSFDFNLSPDFDFSGASIRIGSGNDATYNIYNGFMDEFAIWEHKTLTAENARDLYFSGQGGLLSNDSDADGQALTATKLSDPSLGTLTFNASGAFTYDSTGASSGPQTFTYKVNDGGSDSNVATVTIQVNGPPTGANDPGYSVGLGSVLSVNAAAGVLANDSDPNGDTLSAFLASTPANGVLTLNADGSFDYNATGTSGVKTFTYKVSDGSDEAGPYTVTITVQSANVPSYSNLHGDTVTFTGGGSAVALDSGSDSTVTDADTSVFNGGTLTLSVASGGVSGQDVLAITNVGTGTGQIGVAGSTVSYQNSAIGTFTGGSSGADLVITFNTSAATLAAVQALGRVITYSAGASPTVQNRTVTYSLNDGSNAGTATVTVTVAGAPSSPVITQGAGPLSVTMSEDGSPTAWSVPTLGATDADTADSSLVWSVSSAATNGTATVSGTAAAPTTFTYAPNADFNGSDSFVVQVSDGAQTDTITVNVTVSGVSDNPVITQGAGPLAVTMSEDGSPTAWSAPTLGATDAETANSALVWSVSTAASSGTASVSGTAAAPTTFTYAPNADFNGSDSFVVQVADGASLTDTITVNVTVSGVSDAPVITQGAGPLAVTMSEDGSPTAWSAPTLGATDVETADSALVWSVSTAASSGTASVSGTAAAPTTFTYAPNADFNGSDSFVVQVADGASLTDTITVNVTVSGVSDAPVITQGAGPLAVTMSEDGSPTAWSAPTLGATDVETADSALVWSVSTAASSGTASVSGTAAAPTTFTYAPNADFNGSDSFVVQVADGASLTDTITVNVTVSGVSDNPVITQGAGPLAVTMSEDGSPTAWSAPTLGATDVETADSALVWSVSTAASSGTATVSGTAAAPTTFTYAPNADFNGSDSFVVQVADGASLTDTITVNVTVSGVSDNPVITQGAGPLAVTMSEDGSPTAWSAPTLGATDVETANSALVWSVSTAASSGTATVSGTAAAPTTFTYAPNADFNGSDSLRTCTRRSPEHPPEHPNPTHQTSTAEPSPAKPNLCITRQFRSPGRKADLHTEVPRAPPRAPKTNAPNQHSRAQPSQAQSLYNPPVPVTGPESGPAHGGPQSTPQSTQTQRTKPAQPSPAQPSPISV